MIGRICGVVALAALAAALVGGCGDGSEASSDVTKAQFTKEAEAVCSERKKDWDAKVAEFVKKSEADKVGPKESEKRSEAFFAENMVPLLQTELDSLEDLDAPEADEAKVEKMLENRSQWVEKLEDEGVDALFEDGSLGDFEKEAKAYGLDCSMS